MNYMNEGIVRSINRNLDDFYKDITDKDNIFNKGTFIECCIDGGFIDYDGFGQYAKDMKVYERYVIPSEICKNEDKDEDNVNGICKRINS